MEWVCEFLALPVSGVVELPRTYCSLSPTSHYYFVSNSNQNLNAKKDLFVFKINIFQCLDLPFLLDFAINLIRDGSFNTI